MIEEFSKKVTCPHCQESFDAMVSYEARATVWLSSEGHIPEELKKIKGIPSSEPTNSTMTKAERFRSELDESQRMTIDIAEQTGMLAAFVKTFKRAHGVEPANAPKALLGWMRSAKPKLIPSRVLEYMKSEFGGYINFVAAQSVGAILSQGAIVEFIPTQLVGLSSSAAGLKIGQSEEELARGVEQWVRTKFGYVVGKGAMLDALRKKSFGEFCNPIL